MNLAGLITSPVSTLTRRMSAAAKALVFSRLASSYSEAARLLASTPPALFADFTAFQFSFFQAEVAGACVPELLARLPWADIAAPPFHRPFPVRRPPPI